MVTMRSPSCNTKSSGDRSVVVLQLISLEASTDCEISGGQQYISGRLIPKKFALEGEAVFHAN